MSSIAGIYHFHDGELDTEALTSLGSWLIGQGGDDLGRALTRSAGLIHVPFHTSKESRRAPQPLASPQGLYLVWDGRLDNREELRRAACEPSTVDPTDVQLVLGAYLKWGEEFLTHLVGDYALALWDGARRKLLLARDPFASRQLFYHIDGERIIWASRIKALLRAAPIPNDLDEEYIASYLTKGIEPSRTPYKHVKAVPPAHAVVVTDGRVRVQRFWRLDPRREIRYATDSEYEEHFRELFRNAVRCRLRVEGNVCAELSGGLDSSSIVCVADEILQANEAEASGLTTLSYVFDGSPTSDERAYIRLVEHQRGRRGFHLREEDHPILSPLGEDSFHDFPTPELCFAERNEHVRRTMQQVGARVLLRGTAGDDVLWGEVEMPLEIADLAVEAKPLQMLGSMRSWSTSLRIPYPQLFWRALLLPLMPRRMRAAVPLTPSYRLPAWFSRDFKIRQNLSERMLGPAYDSGYRRPSSREQVSRIQNQVASVSNGFYLRQGSIEVSNPFLDLPLVEFCLAIPLRQMLRPDETRSLLRRALRGLLPEEIARRKTKAGPDEAIHRALIREWPRLNALLAAARVTAYGYAEPDALRQALDRARYGINVNTPALLRILSLEFWLRSFERWHRTSPIPQPAAGEARGIGLSTEPVF